MASMPECGKTWYQMWVFWSHFLQSIEISIDSLLVYTNKYYFQVHWDNCKQTSDRLS